MGKKRLSKRERQLRHFKREAAHRQSKGNTIGKHQFDVGELVKVNGDQVGVIISYEPDLFDFRYSVKKKDFEHTTLSFLDYYADCVAENKGSFPLPDDLERQFAQVADLVSGYWDRKVNNKTFKDYFIATIVPNSVVKNKQTGQVYYNNDFVISQEGTDFVVVSPENEKQHNKMNELMIRVCKLGQVEQDASLLEHDDNGELKELMSATKVKDSYGLGSWKQVIDQMNAVAKKKSMNTGLYKVTLAGGKMEGQKGLTKIVAPINISSYVA